MNHEPMKTNLPFVAALALAGLAAMIIFALTAPAAEADEKPGLIDYPGFIELGTDIAAYRETRLIDLETFNAMKADPDTIIIDARSAGNYGLGHISGAVNLNFSDFSAGMLSEVIGSKQQQLHRQCRPGDAEIGPAGPQRADLHQPLWLWLREHLRTLGRIQHRGPESRLGQPSDLSVKLKPSSDALLLARARLN
jgi:phage shock protein E